MKVLQTRADGVALDLTVEEARILSNALNEICNGIEVEEFKLRIGADLEKAEELLDQFSAALRSTSATVGG